jgi:hypothetical protein
MIKKQLIASFKGNEVIVDNPIIIEGYQEAAL